MKWSFITTHVFIKNLKKTLVENMMANITQIDSSRLRLLLLGSTGYNKRKSTEFLL